MQAIDRIETPVSQCRESWAIDGVLASQFCGVIDVGALQVEHRFLDKEHPMLCRCPARRFRLARPCGSNARVGSTPTSAAIAGSVRRASACAQII